MNFGNVDPLLDSKAGSIPRDFRFVHVRGSTRYLGGRAALLAHSDHVLTTYHIPTSNRLSLPVQVPSISFTDDGMHQFLVAKYFEILDGPFPVLDRDLSFFRDRAVPIPELAPFESFTLHMVYSIACHCLPGNDSRLLLHSDAFYRQALVHAETVTAEISVQALQAVVLLALRSLFDPQNGSLGQQIAFAHRLEIELSARELHEISRTMSRLRSSIYCIGNFVATTLDRPPGLVEPASVFYYA